MTRVLLTLLLLLLVTSCKILSEKEGAHAKNETTINMTGQDEINMVVCEYIITNVIKSPRAGRVYVALDDQQKRLLKARVPRFDVRNLSWDSESNKRRMRHYNTIKVNQVQINEPVAHAEATWRYEYTFMTYEFGLSKVSGWTITNAVVSKGSIAD